MNLTMNVSIKVNPLSHNTTELNFVWTSEYYNYSVPLFVENLEDNLSKVYFDKVADPKLKEVLGAELRFLKSIMEKKFYDNMEQDRLLINNNHLSIYCK